MSEQREAGVQEHRAHATTATYLTVAVVLTGLRQKTEHGEVPLAKGRIQLQTESAEIFFRRIELEHIDAIPRELLK